MRIEVVWSPAAREVRCVTLELAADATVADALAASRAAMPETNDALRVGVWGKACAPDRRLTEGDRVELYRPLQADPKEARRQRARRAASGTRKR